MTRLVLPRLLVAVLGVAIASPPAQVQAAAAKPKKKKKKKKKTEEEIRQEEEAKRQAEIEERALELFASGREKFDLGNFEGAIEDFEGAFELLDEPNLLYNIAQAYAEMADFESAIKTLERYRARAPESEYEMIDTRRAEWQAEIDKNSPDPEPVPAETTPEPGEDGSDSGPTDSGPKTKVYGVGPAILTAVAIAGLGAGIGLGLVSNQRKSEAYDLCVDEDGTQRCQQGFEDRADTNANFALGANIAFGVGGAAALATIIWVSVNAAKRSKEKKRAAMVPHVDGRSAGLSVVGRF